MSLLSLCQDAAADLGLAQPSAIVGSTDSNALKLLRYAQAAGKHLAKYHDWQALIVENTFTTLGQETQTSALPTDYDRFPLNPEIWNRSLHLKYTGPTPQRTRALLKAGIGSGIIGYWWLEGRALHITPNPTAGQTVAFEYMSKNWNQSSGGTGQALWMADTDTAVINEDLFTLEIIWRYRQSRGFPQYAEDMETCEREKEKAASTDRGTGRIRPARKQSDWPPYPIWSGTIDTN